jgi:mannobiose 2-epimerase
VLDVWFPRSLDHSHGGFLCDFDRAWNSTGPHDKLLEFQARQTIFAAEAARALPGDERLRMAAEHGFRYLREVMWDTHAGGWFHRLDRAGRPLEALTKHTHGMAYAIQACVAVYALTRNPAALRHAQEGFEWLERNACDPDHGGYFGFLTRDGRAIRDESGCPWPADTDTIGTLLGCKDVNVHSDSLEAFTALYAVWPEPRVLQRVAELFSLFTQRLITSAGALRHSYLPDWTPVPHLIRFGYAFQTSFRLPLAGQVLGKVERATEVSRRLVRYALRYARDHRAGGFVLAGPEVGPLMLAGCDVRVRVKEWWVQFEALKALLDQHHRDPEDGTYAREFAAQWDYIRRKLLDHQYGGVYATPVQGHLKGRDWKDSSHDGRGLLACANALRGQEVSPFRLHRV